MLTGRSLSTDFDQKERANSTREQSPHDPSLTRTSFPPATCARISLYHPILRQNNPRLG